MQFVQAHTAFDVRHDHLSLAAFPPAAHEYWNAYATGTPISLAQLGITSPWSEFWWRRWYWQS